MKQTVSFGKGDVEFLLPEGVRADRIEPRYPPPLDDPEGAVDESLKRPIGSPPLSELAEGRRSAVIVVPDGTRPLPLPPIVGPIVRRLTEFIAPEKITVLFATGMHRPVGEEEAKRLLGAGLDPRVQVRSHDPADVDLVGTTDSGIPASLNRRYLRSDLRIVAGLVEPHLLAGFSGGRKMIAPGIIGLDAMPLLHGPHLIGHHESKAGKLEGNPFHEEIAEIAAMGRVDFAVNGMIDAHHRLSGVFSGELTESHDAASNWCRGQSLVQVDRKWPVVVTSGGGAPLDATLYQSIKGVAAALPLLEEGGTVILAASCSEGWGSDTFVSLLEEFGRLEDFLAWANRPGSFRLDQWMAQHFLEAKEECRIVLYTLIADGDRPRSFGIDVTGNIHDAIQTALRRTGSSRIVVLPRGPYTWVKAGEAAS